MAWARVLLLAGLPSAATDVRPDGCHEHPGDSIRAALEMAVTNPRLKGFRLTGANGFLTRENTAQMDPNRTVPGNCCFYSDGGGLKAVGRSGPRQCRKPAHLFRLGKTAASARRLPPAV